MTYGPKGIGVPPVFQATGINQIFPMSLFPGTIHANFSQGNRQDLLNNLFEGNPTMVSITLPSMRDVGHVLVVVGYDPTIHQLIFFNPAYNAKQNEKTVLDIYNEGRGFTTFEQLWSSGNIAIPHNSMVTLSNTEPLSLLGISQFSPIPYTGVQSSPVFNFR